MKKKDVIKRSDGIDEYETHNTYHDCGALKHSLEFKNGMRVFRKDYSPDGVLILSMPMVNGVKHGTVMILLDSGFRIEIPHTNGERHGEILRWNADVPEESAYALFDKTVTADEFRKHQIVCGLSGIKP